MNSNTQVKFSNSISDKSPSMIANPEATIANNSSELAPLINPDKTGPVDFSAKSFAEGQAKIFGAGEGGVMNKEGYPAFEVKPSEKIVSPEIKVPVEQNKLSFALSSEKIVEKKTGDVTLQSIKNSKNIVSEYIDKIKSGDVTKETKLDKELYDAVESIVVTEDLKLEEMKKEIAAWAKEVPERWKKWNVMTIAEQKAFPGGVDIFIGGEYTAPPVLTPIEIASIGNDLRKVSLDANTKLSRQFYDTMKLSQENKDPLVNYVTSINRLSDVASEDLLRKAHVSEEDIHKLSDFNKEMTQTVPNIPDPYVGLALVNTFAQKISEHNASLMDPNVAFTYRGITPIGKGKDNLGRIVPANLNVLSYSTEDNLLRLHNFFNGSDSRDIGYQDSTLNIFDNSKSAKKALSKSYKIGLDMLNDYARISIEGDNCPESVIDNLWKEIKGYNLSLKVQMDAWMDSHKERLDVLHQEKSSGNWNPNDTLNVAERGMLNGFKTIEEMSKTKLEDLSRSQKIMQIEKIISSCHQNGWMGMEAILRDNLKDVTPGRKFFSESERVKEFPFLKNLPEGTNFDDLEKVFPNEFSTKIHLIANQFTIGLTVLDFLRHSGNNIKRINGENITEEAMKKAGELAEQKRKVTQLKNEKESELKYGWAAKRSAGYTEHARKTMKKKKEVVSISHVRKNSRMNKRIIF